MGLNEDINLTGNDFTNAATSFFIAYLIAEVPNGLLPNPEPKYQDRSDKYQFTFFKRFHVQNGSEGTL